ncbi:hypothetical protein GH714_011768 [Hevea brasiliensis]|uniref:Smr domain-containing protein n=1 Tax=Hevea brasiliensis TaxID=3981 RepID=A0A6A6NGK4_HEVBR|nr:hypothetical protein GH714_011768 [Hevea brasiliensis]
MVKELTADCLKSSNHSVEWDSLDARDEKSHGHRRTASASADIGGWKIAIAGVSCQANSSNGQPLRKVPSLSGFLSSMDCASKFKLPKSGGRKWKALDSNKESDTARLFSSQLTRGMCSYYEKSKSCLDGCDECYDKQLYGWYGVIQRQLQRSHYQMQYSRPVQVVVWAVLLLCLIDFPPITKNGNCNKLTPVSDSGLVKVLEEKDLDFAFKHLKELHSWTDESLIEDIMASVNNDIDKAITLLEEMISTGNSMEKGEATDLPNCDDFRCSEAAAAHKKPILGQLRSLTVKPKWEEQDVYSSRQRNALRMMRSAASTPGAATNAFLRGDHFSAHQHSSKARKEWLDAERLNAKAAKEILSIRNSENDSWTLDLHGLHAAEAIKALQTHLNKIETLLKNQPVSHGPLLA